MEEGRLSKKEQNKLDRKERRRVAAAAASTSSASVDSSPTSTGTATPASPADISSPEALSSPSVTSSPASASSPASIESPFPQGANYRDISYDELVSGVATGRKWTDLENLKPALAGETVLLRGRVHALRKMSPELTFFTLRATLYSVQCLVSKLNCDIDDSFKAYTDKLTSESYIDVEGLVVIPTKEIRQVTQSKVEIRVSKIFCIVRAQSRLPISVVDCGRHKRKGDELPRVSLDARLKYRTLSLRATPDQAIFTIKSHIKSYFIHYMMKAGFQEIDSPRIIAGEQDSGAAVFSLDYYGKKACLAQSPQLHKQMAVCAGFDKVFEVGTFFRAEDSNTRRHISEFRCLVIEMELKEHYHEVIDIVDQLFRSMFDDLYQNCAAKLALVCEKHPCEKLKYWPDETLKLEFNEGIKMLQNNGEVIADPKADLTPLQEKTLGDLVLKRYGTEFFILYKYPLKARPFYTMPCIHDPDYTNSFDVFIRGVEIMTGGQRMHEPERLILRAKTCDVNIEDPAIDAYIKAMRFGAPPHGGFGAGLERIVMQLCGISDIKEVCLFPRDPGRLVP